MEERYMQFGEYIKHKRKSKGLTLTEVAEHIGMLKSQFSDIENKRKAPFGEEKLKLFAEFIGLSEEETALLYDLAGQYKREVPHDIAGIFMHEEVGQYARTALRLSKECNVPEAEWKQLIRALEAKKAEKLRGDADGSKEDD
jgi:transcriptional regulator with XRE-family HTH domain